MTWERDVGTHNKPENMRRESPAFLVLDARRRVNARSTAAAGSVRKIAADELGLRANGRTVYVPGSCPTKAEESPTAENWVVRAK
jgi:hypothetical protein